MTTTLTFNGRLPGVVCETALPPPAEQPLRLDVAAFVGFAERGPLDVPVQLEDSSQYSAIFGGDLAVARDGGTPVYAYLPGVVQAFFANGGRRCYAVRVAGAGARPNHFRLPGLLARAADGSERAVVAPAAWAGRWSDVLRVGTQLSRRRLRFQGYDAADPGLVLDLPAGETLGPGDLLRLRFDGVDAPVQYLAVAQVQRERNATAGATSARVTVSAAPDATQTFATARVGALPPPDALFRLEGDGWRDLGCAPDPPTTLPHGRYALSLPYDPRIQPGDLLRLTFPGTEELLFATMSVEVRWDQGSASPPASPPAGPSVYLTSREALWRSSTPPALGQLIEVDRLGFDLLVGEGDATPEAWHGLRFGSGSGYWVDVLAHPSDLADAPSVARLLNRSVRLAAPPEALAPSTPLYLPLGMADLPGPDEFAGPLAEDAASSAPGGKDGLDLFDAPALFLDPNLAASGVATLRGDAEQLLYRSAPPVPLMKLHSLLPIDEIGLIAVPDAAHRAWGPPEALPIVPEPSPPAPPPPDWSYFQDCDPPQPPAPPTPGLPERAPCDAPFAWQPAPDDTGVDDDPRRRLERLPVLQLPAQYAVEPLLRVQQALIRLCAARADLLAVLGLPGHFAAGDALAWQQAIGAPGDLRDGAALSYAAVYHPWLQIREPSTPQLALLRPVPPDGAMCGLIAARELARGVWVAPANLTLGGVVGLSQALPGLALTGLFDAQVNLLVQQPGRFTPLSAHTLSLDRLLVQVNVRRLLIFLRKLALRRGMRYVFESNNERFRRRVQVVFERTLSGLAARGALTAFEVTTGDGLNTQNDFDNGRFLIALKVAPTLPIEFITVVLVRSGEGLLDVIER